MQISQISLRTITYSQTLATIYIIIMCVQIVAIEGYGISPVKVGVMATAPLIFLLKVPYISKALILGGLYWVICYFSAIFNGDMRFSTIGYLAMFIISYIVFYNLLHAGAFSLAYFIRLLRILILAFGTVLVLQQGCLLVGIRSFAIINLSNQPFLSLTKLPSLCIEPSHSARILSFLILAYWRCIEIDNDGNKMTISKLFIKEHRWVTISFLWTMLTMGSGTAFIGLGILSLYFINRKTVLYIVPLLVGLFILGQKMELEQMDRAVRVIRVTTSVDSKNIMQTDGSAAVRILPLINTLTNMDITSRDTWFGKGTISLNERTHWTKKIFSEKIGNIDQYGLLSYIVVLFIVFTCCISRFISLETLLAFALIGLTINNFAYVWGCFYILTSVRYFAINYK